MTCGRWPSSQAWHFQNIQCIYNICISAQWKKKSYQNTRKVFSCRLKKWMWGSFWDSFGFLHFGDDFDIFALYYPKILKIIFMTVCFCLFICVSNPLNYRWLLKIVFGWTFVFNRKICGVVIRLISPCNRWHCFRNKSKYFTWDSTICNNRLWSVAAHTWSSFLLCFCILQ